MNKLWLYRVCTLALVAVFSVIVLGLSAYSASILDEVKAAVGPQSEPITYAALGITVSTITLVSTVSMLALDLTFDSLFTSYIIFEFSWLTVLWMFWVAVGSVTIDNDQELYLQLPCWDPIDVVAHIVSIGCSRIRPLQAFEFINSGLLFIYTVSLVVIALRMKSSKGSSSWTTSLKHFTK